MKDNKWVGWLVAIVGILLIGFLIYDSMKKKGNPDSLEKARQAKADKATLRNEPVDGTIEKNDASELKEEVT